MIWCEFNDSMLQSMRLGSDSDQKLQLSTFELTQTWSWSNSSLHFPHKKLTCL